MTTVTRTPAELDQWATELIDVVDFWTEYPVTPDSEIGHAREALGTLAAAEIDGDAVLSGGYSLDLGPILSAVLSTVDPSGDGARSAALWSLFPLAAVVDGVGYLYSSPALVYSPSRWGISPPRAVRPAVERVAAAADIDLLAAVVAIADAYCESVDEGDDSSSVTVAGVAIDYREAATYWDLVRLAVDLFDETYPHEINTATVDKVDEEGERALRVLLACGDALAAVVSLVDHANEL